MVSHDSKDRPDLVALRTFNDEAEADLAKSALSAAGIPSITLRDDCGGMRPSLSWAQGVRLMVSTGYIEEANRILAGEGQDSNSDSAQDLK